MAKKDLHLFFDEMSDIHEVDDKQVQIIIDTERLREKQRIGNALITACDMMIFIRTEDVPEQKTVGQTMTVDGRIKTIDMWDEVDGITEITLSDNGGMLV